MQSIDSSDVRRLLIRATNWIGDAVMTTPAMGALRSAFPHAQVTVAANPVVAELFRTHPYCDRVVVFDKKGEHGGIKGLIRFAHELRREQFDLAILLQNAFEAAALVRLAGIPGLGYCTDGRTLLLSHALPIGREDRRLHHTSYYRLMLERVGISGGDGRLRLQCTNEEIAWAGEILRSGSWIAINPGAAYGSAKRWLPERFAEVADRLSVEYGTRILLTGGPAETKIGRDIEEIMKCTPLNMIGRTTVRQLMALLSLCRLVVTNDSGPMHIAAAFDVPIVALFGPTDHTTTSPLTASCRIIRRNTDCAPCLLRSCPTDHRCMTSISAEDVLTAARDLLGKVQ